MQKAAYLWINTRVSSLALNSSPPGRSLAFLLLRDCPVDGSDLVCRLAPVLRGLQVVAAVLAIILVVVVALAVLIYRRRSNDRNTVL